MIQYDRHTNELVGIRDAIARLTATAQQEQVPTSSVQIEQGGEARLSAEDHGQGVLADPRRGRGPGAAVVRLARGSVRLTVGKERTMTDSVKPGLYNRTMQSQTVALLVTREQPANAPIEGYRIASSTAPARALDFLVPLRGLSPEAIATLDALLDVASTWPPAKPEAAETEPPAA